MEIMLDTNVLIEILKNNTKTISEVKKFDKLYISAITQMELYYGALNKNELKKIEKFTTLFNIINLDKKISINATNLIYKYSKSHGLDVPDSLIASTAISFDMKLLTYNKKDFKFIEKLELY
jgi:predicted nucleic acid-binding protein